MMEHGIAFRDAADPGGRAEGASQSPHAGGSPAPAGRSTVQITAGVHSHQPPTAPWPYVTEMSNQMNLGKIAVVAAGGGPLGVGVRQHLVQT